MIASAAVDDRQHGTAIMVDTKEEAGPHSRSAGAVTIDVMRVLRSDSQAAQSPAARSARGHVLADWRAKNGDESRGLFVVLRDTAR